jgi:hypothetical protein
MVIALLTNDRLIERLRSRAAPLTRARELSPTAALCREAADEIERLRHDAQPAKNAPVLTERLIQAAVDYEQGRCSSRELAEARAAVEAAMPGAAQPTRMASGDWAQLLTLRDVMKTAYKRGGDRLMSVWERDLNAIEAAIMILDKAARPPAAPVDQERLAELQNEAGMYKSLYENAIAQRSSAVTIDLDELQSELTDSLKPQGELRPLCLKAAEAIAELRSRAAPQEVVKP